MGHLPDLHIRYRRRVSSSTSKNSSPPSHRPSVSSRRKSGSKFCEIIIQGYGNGLVDTSQLAEKQATTFNVHDRVAQWMSRTGSLQRHPAKEAPSPSQSTAAATHGTESVRAQLSIDPGYLEDIKSETSSVYSSDTEEDELQSPRVWGSSGSNSPRSSLSSQDETVVSSLNELKTLNKTGSIISIYLDELATLDNPFASTATLTSV